MVINIPIWYCKEENQPVVQCVILQRNTNYYKKLVDRQMKIAKLRSDINNNDVILNDFTDIKMVKEAPFNRDRRLDNDAVVQMKDD